MKNAASFASPFAPVLEIRDLCLWLEGSEGKRPILSSVDLCMGREVLGLIGLSGAGKSQLALSILNLLPPHAVRTASRLNFCGSSLLHCNPSQMQKLRGSRIALLGQDPRHALNPGHPIGAQLMEVAQLHLGVPKRVAHDYALGMLQEVGFSAPQKIFHSYAYQLSTGMCQKVALALALLPDPELLIADEPSSALDQATCSETMLLMGRMVEEKGMGLLLMSHDSFLLSNLCKKAVLLSQGRSIPLDQEALCTQDQWRNSLGDLEPVSGVVPPFCAQTVSATSACEGKPFQKERRKSVTAAWSSRFWEAKTEPITCPPQTAMLVVEKVELWEGLPGRGTPIVQDVNFSLEQGAALGIMGPIGSGKSTLLRLLCGLLPARGKIRIAGHSFCASRGGTSGKVPPWGAQCGVQLVFQDCYAALHPYRKIGWSLHEPFRLRAEPLDRTRIHYLFSRLGLDPALLSRYPDQLSGGQRQRILLLRGLLSNPRLLLLDEITAALDHHSCMQVLDLLEELRQESRMTFLVVSHDLSVIEALCTDFAFLQRGKFSVMENLSGLKKAVSLQ